MPKKVSLANRKRTKELGNANASQNKLEELLALRSETSQPGTRADKHFNEVETLVKQLQDKWAELSVPSSHNRLQYSRQQQHDLLVADLKATLLKKAESSVNRGMAEDKALTICQALADDVRIALAHEGININPLHLNRKRQPRM